MFLPMAHSVTAARHVGDFAGERGETVQAPNLERPALWRALPLSPPTASAELYRSGAVGVYFGLLSLPVGRWLPGVIELPGAQGLGARLAAWLPLGADELDAHLDALGGVGLLKLDREHGLVYAPALVSVGVPTSIKQIDGIRAQWLRLRQSAVVEQARQDLLAAVDALEPVRKARGRSKQEPERTIAERLREALGCHLVSLPARPLHPQQPLPLVPCLRVVREEEPVTQQDLSRAVADAPNVPVDPEELLRRQFEEEDREHERRKAKQDRARAEGGGYLRAHQSAEGQTAGVVEEMAFAGAGVGGQRYLRYLQGERFPSDAVARAFLRDVAPATAIEHLWRAAVAICPSLDGGVFTSTTLSSVDNCALALQWAEGRKHGWGPAEIELLADYIKAGALDFAHSKASTAARNVQRYVGEAKIWHANKRPALRKGPAPRKFLGGGR